MSSDWPRFSVSQLQAEKKLLVEDGNHGEYRPRPNEFQDHGVSFIRAADMSDGRVLFNSAQCINELARSRIRKGIGLPGDVLLSHKGTVGKVAYVPTGCPDFVCSPQTTFWRVMDEQTLDRSFLCAYLQSAEFKAQLASRKGETDMADYVSLTAQRQLQVPVPSISIQRGIGKIFSALNDRITLLRETNATLEAIAQALFKSWFVDFDPVHAKAEGRQPEGMDAVTAALFPDSFEESELGLAPKGWMHCRVEDFAEKVGMGPFGSNIKVETFVSQGVPVISGQHLRQVLVEDSTFNFIASSHAEKLSNSCVYEGDVVFTHAGSIGQVALLHRHARFDRYVLSQRQFFLRCDRQKMRPEWIAYYFHSAQGQHQLLANASQVGVPSIARPVSYLRSIVVLVPSKDLIDRFSDIADGIHQKVLANRNRIQTLTQLRDTLLPRLISGQLRLPEAEGLIEEAV
ncbi:restriction endonuclease subunit S [Metapseudomonas lalkuanensis]|uniref:restriction endonuclease subunit S n=1 Tax=Metapseudomonas lalkuanensis TaxID=2604832 RepID=UPI001CF47CA8|nr:restriction endonuclease subunit S [Pseudomonas lalkuanensis]UCO96404.1 restriction endonuclease subunit S [Pseudomonas lalkuanensis]